MKRALVVVLALTAAAAAAPVPLVTPPAGWVPDPEQAAQLAQKIAALKPFGGGKLTVAADTHVPKAPGVALFVTRISVEELAISREAAAREAIDDLKRSAVELYDWRVLPMSDAKAIVARGEWTDKKAGTQTVGMVVIAASATRFVAVRGECFSADKSDGSAVNACVQALQTLDPGVPVAERVAFEPAPENTAPATPAGPAKPSNAPLLTDGQDVQLTPIRVEPERKETDRRPVYLGGAIVVIAALSWWNRRRREKFEREDRQTTAGTADPANAPDGADEADDDDADDLAAAARGGKPKDDA